MTSETPTYPLTFEGERYEVTRAQVYAARTRLVIDSRMGQESEPLLVAVAGVELARRKALVSGDGRGAARGS